MTRKPEDSGASPQAAPSDKWLAMPDGRHYFNLVPFNYDAPAGGDNNVFVGVGVIANQAEADALEAKRPQ